MTDVRYGIIEVAVKNWLLTRPEITALVPRPDGGVSIFNNAPASLPKPAIVVRRVGGGPRIKDFPEERARVSCHVWATSFTQAASIAAELVSTFENLARNGFAVAGDTILYSAEVLGSLWLPDPDSDTPRYVVDALITTVTA